MRKVAGKFGYNPYSGFVAVTSVLLPARRLNSHNRRNSSMDRDNKESKQSAHVPPMRYLHQLAPLVPIISEEHRASTALEVVQLMTRIRYELGHGLSSEMLALETNAVACLTRYLAVPVEDKADQPVTARATAE